MLRKDRGNGFVEQTLNPFPWASAIVQHKQQHNTELLNSVDYLIAALDSTYY